MKTKYGLRFVVLQQGSIGQFDFLTLLLTGTASLSLLAIATVLVDFLATNVLADRKLYSSAKVQKTIAFNKVTPAPASARPARCVAVGTAAHLPFGPFQGLVMESGTFFLELGREWLRDFSDHNCALNNTTTLQDFGNLIKSDQPSAQQASTNIYEDDVPLLDA